MLEVLGGSLVGRRKANAGPNRDLVAGRGDRVAGQRGEDPFGDGSEVAPSVMSFSTRRTRHRRFGRRPRGGSRRAAAERADQHSVVDVVAACARQAGEARLVFGARSVLKNCGALRAVCCVSAARILGDAEIRCQWSPNAVLDRCSGRGDEVRLVPPGTWLPGEGSPKAVIGGPVADRIERPQRQWYAIDVQLRTGLAA